MSAISGGKKGKGTAIGTAIGGGAGLFKGLLSKGKDAVIPAGTPLDVVLEQALSVPGGGSQQPQYNNTQPYGQQNPAGYPQNYNTPNYSY